jgi:AcrR family transcriptional regulator
MPGRSERLERAVNRPVSRRDEIMAVAKVQIAERGYDGTSMRDIADAVGLQAGSLYSHFRSKAELVGEVVDRFYAELVPRQRAILSTPGSGAAQLAAMVPEVFSVCLTHKAEITIVHYDWHVLSKLDELDNAVARSLEALSLWEAVIRRGQDDGSIIATFDAENTVRMVVGAMHSLIDTVRIDARPALRLTEAQRRANLEDLVLGGLLTRRPRRRRTAELPVASPTSR